MNEVAEQQMNLFPLDVRNELCAEVDDAKDLESVRQKLHDVENRRSTCAFPAI